MPTVVKTEQLGDKRKSSSWEEGLSKSHRGKEGTTCFDCYRMRREGFIHHAAVLPGGNFTYSIMSSSFFNPMLNDYN